ncbi:hypothetical protein [Methylobacterium sp. D48H]
MMRDANHRQKAEFIDRDKCIAYILQHQFVEDSADPNVQINELTNSPRNIADDKVRRAEQLKKLDDTEILKIYRAIKDEEAARRRISSAAMEPFLFFNQPSADADFAYWLDIEIWTPDQAAALSLGKEPSVVNADSMRGPLRSSKVRATYRNRSDAILSAVQARMLPENIQPRAFIAWATQKSWALPNELQSWAKRATYEQILNRVEHLESEIARLEDARKSAMTQSMDELDPRLQRTFYKIILTMAIARYEHRVSSNSRGPSQIVDDSEQILDDRLILKVDAVRDALQKAADYLGVTSNYLVPPKWIRIRK